jgi:hypothetical protein
VLKALLRHGDHLPRSITSEDRDAFAGQKDGIFSGATVDFENVVVRIKGFCENPPYGFALRTSNERISKSLIVVLRDAVKGCASSRSGAICK